MKNKILELLKKEEESVCNYINLTSSFNYINSDILRLKNSITNNVYLTEHNCNIDDLDELYKTINDLCKKLFDSNFSSIKAENIEIAKEAVCTSLLKKKDKILYITFENESNLLNENSNKRLSEYQIIRYNACFDNYQIDYEKLKTKVLSVNPKLVIVEDYPYPRKIEYDEIKEITSMINAYLLVDMSSISGLVAAKIYQNPCKYADVVITNTNGSLRCGSAVITLSRDDEMIKQIDKYLDENVGYQINLNTIISVLLSLDENTKPNFVSYQKQTIKNAKMLCDVFRMENVKVISNGTDNQNVLIDTKKSFNITGKEASIVLKDIGIVCNKNLIPNDLTTPYITSGLLISTLSATTRGFKEKDFLELGKIICKCLKNSEDVIIKEELKKQVKLLCTFNSIYEEE